MLPTLFRPIRKGLFVVLPLALLGGYAINDALSHWHGMPYYSLPEIGGCDAGANLQDPCHGAANSSTVIHVFIPDTIFAATTYALRISVSNKSPLDVAAGFSIAVDTPAILDTVPGMNTYVESPIQYPAYSITHSKPQFFPSHSDSAVWTFLYTARPTPGFDTIYAAGNAVDGDSASPDLADHWDSTSVIITVVPAPSFVASALSSNLFQIYPNPASNEIFINDGIPADVGTYTITDPAGRVVLYGRQFSLDGSRSIDISGIASGAYILNVQPRMGQAFSRNIAIQH